MSYETMWKDDTCCDFPLCADSYYGKKDAKVAIVRDNKILAFCEKHSARLEREGINLRPLSDVHKELDDIQQAPFRSEVARRENAFIEGLKSK